MKPPPIPQRHTKPPPLPGRRKASLAGVVVLAASLVITVFVVLMVLEACKPTQPVPRTPDRPAQREVPERPKAPSEYFQALVRDTAPVVEAKDADDRLTEYFREGNKGVADYKGPYTERAVTDGMRRAVIWLDGGKCLLCESGGYLEVDHRRALSNGGSNEPANLAALCDPCHNAKSKMDGALRRQRQKRN